MLVFATGLILVGGLLALYGHKLFRILLPIAGLVVGAMVGFTGVQAVLGTGAISLSIAILMAVIVAVIMALLSFAFYDLAVIILTALLGASVLTFLGIAIGLEDNGFILFLLGLAGAVMGIVAATGSYLSTGLIFAVTSMVGVALILAAVMLFAGELTLDQLHDEGVVRAVVNEVDQSFLWLFVWLAGSLVAMNVQMKLATQEFITSTFEYSEKN